MKKRILALTLAAVCFLAAGCGLKSGNKKEFDDYRKEVCQLYDAEYTDLAGDLTLDGGLGRLVYAGKTGEGEEAKVALYVQSGKKVDGAGGQEKGYDAQYPQPYRMIIIVNRQTDEVDDYKVVFDGTKNDYFIVPKAKLDAYVGTKMTGADAYDNFKDGLVTEPVAATEHVTVPEDSIVIAGTSILYTGATVNGTYSSQFVRNCYKAAAAYYATLNEKD